MKNLLLPVLAVILLLASCSKKNDDDIHNGTYKMVSWSDTTKWPRVEVRDDLHISYFDEGTTFKVNRRYYGDDTERQLMIMSVDPYGNEDVYTHYPISNYATISYDGEIDSLSIISPTEFKRYRIYSNGNGANGPNTVISVQHFVKQ